MTPGFKPFTNQGKLTEYKVRFLRKYWSPRRRRATLSEETGTCAALKLRSSGRCDELYWREQRKTAVVAFEKTEQDETSQYEDDNMSPLVWARYFPSHLLLPSPLPHICFIRRHGVLTSQFIFRTFWRELKIFCQIPQTGQNLQNWSWYFDLLMACSSP